MSIALTRKESRPDVRRQALATALHLFSTRGYFNTSVHDICREADISVGSVYHHFGDKEGVARAMYEDIVRRMDESLDDIERRHASAHDRCRAVMAHLFGLTESEPELMAFMLHAKHREFLPEEKPMCSSRPFQRMRDFVARGIETGEISRMDSLIAAASLYGGALRLIHLRLDGLADRPLPECLDELWPCAWRSIAA